MTFKELILKALAPKATGGMLVDGVALYGDSIMADQAHRMRLIYPHLIVDRSIPGDTARKGWVRFPCEGRMPRTVVLQYGTNDLTLGDNPLPYLKAMAQHAQAEGREVVLTGISTRADRSVYDVNLDIYRLAQDIGATFAHWDYAGLIAPDGLHPGDAMANTLAQLTVDAVNR